MRQTVASVTIVMMGDTHGMHRALSIPHAEILIHAGDFTFFSRSVKEIEDYNEWLGELPHRSIVVPGNHESFLEVDPSRRRLLSNATVLINEGVEILGLRLWGSPVTPLNNTAYGIASEAKRRQIYAAIPEHTDIVVSHGPAYGILDRTSGSSTHHGCRALREAIARVKPKLFVCGHIHGAYGIVQTPDTVFVNCALPGHFGDIEKPPILMKMSRRTPDSH